MFLDNGLVSAPNTDKCNLDNTLIPATSRPRRETHSHLPPACYYCIVHTLIRDSDIANYLLFYKNQYKAINTKTIENIYIFRMLLLTQVNFKILLTVNKFSAKIMGWAASTCFDNVLTCKEHI